MALPKRFLSAYYFLNPLLLASYVGLRLHYERMSAAEIAKYSRMKSVFELNSWEKQCMFTMVAVYGFKLFRMRSWDNYIMQVFYYGQVLMLLMSFMVDLRLCFWVAVAVWGLYVALPQPMYDLEEAGIQPLTPALIKETVLTRSEATPSWVVFAYTGEHADSTAMASIIGELARTYASPGLRFGSIDVVLWPNVAEAMGVRSQVWENKLPSVLLYEKGKEVTRVPTKTATADFTARNYFTREDILKGLDLAARAAKASGGIVGGSGSATAAKASSGGSAARRIKGA